MKKRLTSVLLTIVMVASLFSGMAVTAHADGDTIEYTLQSGDTVYNVCRKLGIDFYANYDWITSTNKITNYSGLAVGRKIILPASGTIGSTTPSTPSTTPSGTTNVKLLTGDSVVSYLVPHVVSYGDTLYDICLAKGVDYNKNVDLILKLNGLKSANRIAVGRTLLLPSDKAPASGSCVAVVGHKIVSGDATFNICQSYGISYNDNVDLMKALNGKENMAVIKTGQTLLVPVPATVVAGSTGGTTGGTNNGNTNNGNTNNGNTNNGNTNNDTNNGGTTTTTSYTITKNTTNVDRGSYSVLVNNTNSSTAAAGATVTVNATAKTGYKLDYVKATAANGSSIAMNGTTFTMPSSNVTIDVYFVSSKDYRITQTYPTNGSYTTVVNGSTTDDAAPGQVVEVVVAPEDGYMLDKITVKASSDSVTVAPPVVTNKTFVMPNYDVTVAVEFVKAPANGSAIIKELIEGSGTFDVKINGNVVSSAKAGEVVSVDLKPSDGYVLKKIEVRPNTAENAGDTIAVSSSNTFVMPHYPVKVKVYYVADEFNIISSSTTNGSFIVYKVGDNTQAPVSKVTADTQLVVKATADKGYAVKTVKYTDKDGNVKEVTANGSGAYVFVMPTRDTTVSVEFRKGNYALYEVNNNATFQKAGKTVTYANPGDEVTVVPNAIDGYKVSKITAKQGNNDITVKNNKFTMPIGKVDVTVSYEKVELKITKASTSNGSFTIKANDNNGATISKAKLGDIVYVASSPKSGYYTSKIIMTDAKGNSCDITGPQKFEMPGTAVTVSVTYTKSTDTGIG